MSTNLEEGLSLVLDFEKLQTFSINDQIVIPVVVQDSRTKDVLIIAYANKIALEHTIQTNCATFWSTSRDELWEKGKTSGDCLIVDDILVNCEQNALLYLVTPEKKGACHTKDKLGQSRTSCFYRKISDNRLHFI